MRPPLVALNSSNRRIGQGHPQAKLQDADVDAIFELREQGMSLREIAQKFDVGHACVWKVLAHTRRADLPAKWRPAGKAKPPDHAAPAPPVPSEGAVLLQNVLLQAWR